MKDHVTGTTGFLGGKLFAALLNQGHDVRVLVWRTSDLSSLPSHPSLDLAYGDVTDCSSILAVVSGCDVVFHVAAPVEPWLPDPSRLISVNVGGLEHVLRAVREFGNVQKVVYTSSFFTLGPMDGCVADESQVHHEKIFCTVYEKSNR